MNGGKSRPAELRGALSGLGKSESQPGRRGFTTRGGVQRACLVDPADADFSLSLQRWNGRKFVMFVEMNQPGDVKDVAVRTGRGTYRWVVSSTSGAGDYTLRMSAP